jgi:hypothetical protein
VHNLLPQERLKSRVAASNRAVAGVAMFHRKAAHFGTRGVL